MTPTGGPRLDCERAGDCLVVFIRRHPKAREAHCPIRCAHRVDPHEADFIAVHERDNTKAP